jgi:hypothetical protein
VPWDGLTRSFDDDRIGLDSNVVERAIRRIALGRKNHLIAGSDMAVVSTGRCLPRSSELAR